MPKHFSAGLWLVVGSFEAKTPISGGASLSGKRDARMVGSKQLIGGR
jgi:hypothetical protein